jgi:DNA repair protein RecN (Recombination protein N)
MTAGVGPLFGLAPTIGAMLRELAVQNLALIEDVRVELQGGFCAWSGETGAGKTLLLDALGLLLGERGDVDLIRDGCEELRITGRFELARIGLRQEVERLLDAPLEGDEVVLTRRLSRSGRGYAYVNDHPAAVSTLRRVGAVLVDVHGQRESLCLLEPGYQLDLLDAFGDLQTLRNAYFECAGKLRELRRRHSELAAAKQQRQRELALLRFEREELAAANLVAGELAELALQRQRLANAQALTAFAESAVGRLYDDEGAIFEQAGKLLREGQSWVNLDPALAETAQGLQRLANEARELASTFRGLLQTWQADPARREEVEERFQLLRRLETKYGMPVDELIAYQATLDEREGQLQGEETETAGLEAELAGLFTQVRQAGEALGKERRKVARRFAGQVQKQLADLGMADAVLEAVLTPLDLGSDPLSSDLPARGLEQLELLLAANPGEPPRPLRKIASGGELSRTMLALKTVLAAHDQVGTLVFDEIDANVGGRLGDVLGKKLAALGQTHQVICVTHLPQVASYARHQWSIRKVRSGKRTTTTIECLDEAARLDELASMLRGEAKGETTRKEAQAMLSAARKAWK